jgi:hypothetical protein
MGLFVLVIMAVLSHGSKQSGSVVVGDDLPLQFGVTSHDSIQWRTLIN